MDYLTENHEVATIGGGCFWCIEAIYLDIKGIISVTSGYSGGTTQNPTYREVSSGMSGHAEVIQLIFDPKIISYGDILKIFFQIHDPTTRNRQGADVGTQYRSVIFYHHEVQKGIAEKVMIEIGKSALWKNPLVTELLPYTMFYPAESYHQDYYANNPNQPYCSIVIAPKLKKFRKSFGQFLKDVN